MRSVGSFSFLIETNTATFEEQVNVRSTPRDKPQNVDQIQCDLLSLMFARKAKETAKTPALTPPPASRPNKSLPKRKEAASIPSAEI